MRHQMLVTLLTRCGPASFQSIVTILIFIAVECLLADTAVQIPLPGFDNSELHVVDRNMRGQT